MANKKITIRESELRGLLDDAHEKGYKTGLDVGRSIQKSVDDPFIAELQDKRARLEVSEIIVTGLAPAAQALARIALGPQGDK
jgi:hypothetical protein